MHRVAILSLFTIHLVSAQYPGTPWGGGACKSDWDCSLGGVCNASSVCACDIWFTGPTCTYLNLAPADINQGLQVPAYFSWGGHAARDNVTGVYHGYFSFLCNHANLGQWTTDSAMVHATASTPEGPYTYADLVMPPWSHNTMLHQEPVSQQWQIWHIGNGVVPPSKWYPCFNASEATDEYARAHKLGAYAPAEERAAAEAAAIRAKHELGQQGVTNMAFVELGASLEGPWTSYANDTGVFANTSAWWSSTSNPTPFSFANGTTIVYHSAQPCPAGWGNLAPNCIGAARADTWEGPFTEILPVPITHPEGEDPFVWQDPRGNFHLLTNVNTYHARCAAGVPCGGHAWSQDGITWSNMTVGAFGPVIRLTNGSYWVNAYIERPQIYFENGVPRTFFGGLGRTSYMDSASWAQAFCQPGMTGCGPTIPPPPTIVRMQFGSQCIITNTTNFPCPGGHGNSCPIFLGDCSDPSAQWYETGSSTLQNVAVNAFINIDCNSCASHSLAKALEGDGNMFTFSNGQLVFGGGCSTPMCLNTGQGPAVPPCEGGEFYMPTQLQIEPCSSPDTQGWVRVVVN